MLIRQFLLDLSSKPETVRQWKIDKEAVMTAAGLSEADKAILRSGDPGKIQDALNADVGLEAAEAPPFTVILLIE
jgi:hypothetical protein